MLLLKLDASLAEVEVSGADDWRMWVIVGAPLWLTREGILSVLSLQLESTLVSIIEAWLVTTWWDGLVLPILKLPNILETENFLLDGWLFCVTNVEMRVWKEVYTSGEFSATDSSWKWHPYCIDKLRPSTFSTTRRCSRSHLLAIIRMGQVALGWGEAFGELLGVLELLWLFPVASDAAANGFCWLYWAEISSSVSTANVNELRSVME